MLVVRTPAVVDPNASQRGSRPNLVAVACLLAACGVRSSTPVGSPSTPIVARSAPTCSSRLRAEDILASNARSSGDRNAVRGVLPLRLVGTASQQEQKGRFELALSSRLHAQLRTHSGLIIAEGVDAQGPWEVGPGGVALRLHDDETEGRDALAWVLRREYLSASPSAARCEMRQGELVATVEYALPAQGNPELVFDLATGELRSFQHTYGLGRRREVRLSAWTTRGSARFPTSFTVSGGREVAEIHGELVDGAPCEAALSPTDGCTAAPDSGLRITWPAEGLVRIPARRMMGGVALKVRVAGRQVWGLLDSGAGVTAVDTTAPLASAFTPSGLVTAHGGTESMTAGLGHLDTIELGPLRATHVPTVAIPIPGTDVFGALKPEVVLGYSLFATAAVRIDFRKNEVVMARSADRLVTPGSTRIRMRAIEGHLYVDAKVEGHPGTFEIDTGNIGHLTLEERWAETAGILRDRPTVGVQAVTGAGTQASSIRYLRLQRFELGPLYEEQPVAQVSRLPTIQSEAGNIGMEFLSGCSAIIVDVPGRSLHLEPPCVSIGRSLAWDIAFAWKRAADGRAARFIVQKLLPGGAGTVAGLEEGDELVSVDGRPPGDDRTELYARLRLKPGRKVELAVERKGKRLRLVLGTQEALPRIPEVAP